MFLVISPDTALLPGVHVCRLGVLHRGLPGARVTERGGPGVVVDEVANALPRVTDLPTFGQGVLVLQPAAQHNK